MIDLKVTTRPSYSCNVISKRNETMVLDSTVEGVMPKSQPAARIHVVAELVFTAISVIAVLIILLGL